jgi:ubiquinone/menaquinone biosynthesis C-methylase UbiE
VESKASDPVDFRRGQQKQWNVAAAGYGEPALTAARAAGPEGKVTATDISPEMLAYGRERAATQGISNIEFVEADASSLGSRCARSA